MFTLFCMSCRGVDWRVRRPIRSWRWVQSRLHRSLLSVLSVPVPVLCCYLLSVLCYSLVPCQCSCRPFEVWPVLLLAIFRIPHSWSEVGELLVGYMPIACASDHSWFYMPMPCLLTILSILFVIQPFLHWVFQPIRMWLSEQLCLLELESWRWKEGSKTRGQRR